jgi:hypothetical protein
MRRTADVWAAPPGGFAEGARPASLWRRARKPVAIALVVVLGLGGVAMMQAMGESTTVSADDALAEFRSESSGSDAPATEGTSKSKAKKVTGKGAAAAASSVAAGETDEAGTDEARADEGSTSTNAAPSSDTDQPGSEPVASEDNRPAAGVYTWQIDGYEEAPGVNRRLPERSPRIVTHKSGNSWQEHLRFSEQREQWFELSVSPEGVSSRSVRNRVQMGPVEVDRTVVFNPPMFVNVFPMKVGRTWKGSWDGKTRGDYRGRTFEHTTVTIEGEKVEVWGSEVIMEMTGEVEGRVVTRTWVAPDYNMVVKQYQNMNVTSGPGEYHSEWTGQVMSLTPQT